MYIYEELWVSDKWNYGGCKGCISKILVVLYGVSVYPIFQSLKMMIVLVFVVVCVIVLIVAVMYLIVDLYFVSLFCICFCHKRRRQKILDMKRYSYVLDYIVYDIILRQFHGYLVVSYVTQMPPWKAVLNPLIIIWYQSRYVSKFLRSNTLPKYNLKWDYITYDILDNNSDETPSRWLPSISKDKINSLPDINKVAELFARSNDDRYIPEQKLKLNLLFAYYMKFIMEPLNDMETSDNTSGFNLSQLYGSSNENCDNFRKFEDGLFKSITIDEYEFPEIKIISEDTISNGVTLRKGTKYFNVPNGLQRIKDMDFHGIYIIWFRHHQLIARSIKIKYTDFDDERIFQTARLINILCLLKCTLALMVDTGIIQAPFESVFNIDNLENIFDGIKHRIFGQKDRIFPNSTQNIPIELSILSQWDQLYTPKIEIYEFKDEDRSRASSISSPNGSDTDDKKISEATPMNDIKFDDNEAKNGVNISQSLKLPFPNAVKYLSHQNGLETFIQSIAKTRVGQLTLNNMDTFTVENVVTPLLKKTRQYRLASFNDYRERMGYYRYNSIDEINDDPKIVNALKQVYGENGVDNIEYYVGIFAEQKYGNSLGGIFLNSIFTSAMITHITSSPLLRMNWNEMITPLGKQIFNECGSFHELISRHTKLYNEDCGFRTNEECIGYYLPIINNDTDIDDATPKHNTIIENLTGDEFMIAKIIEIDGGDITKNGPTPTHKDMESVVDAVNFTEINDAFSKNDIITNIETLKQ